MLQEMLGGCRLIASVQAADGSPVQDPATLARLAQASQAQGVNLLRLQGSDSIKVVGQATGLPVIGLIKRAYPGSEVYITPTLQEVGEVIDAGAQIVAMDGTMRPRSGGEGMADLVRAAHARGMSVLADIDSVESARYAIECGADALSTTLGGYTKERPATDGPDLVLIREVVQARLGAPVLAEGRFEEAWQIEAALRIGAAAVVVGGALNDPDKNTRRLMPKPRPRGNVGAVDIGGTWIRFGLFSPEWELIESHRMANPPNREARIAWIKQQVDNHHVERLGVGTGGIVDPATGEVWTAKEYLMPDHVGLRFDEATFGIPVFASGDGHATAWGHACLPNFAGLRVATLALGTGVGCGFVASGKIWCGRRGEYPRINDLRARGGSTFEELLGGFHLGSEQSAEYRAVARTALADAAQTIRDLYFPDFIVVAGSVGLSDWMSESVSESGLVRSPFGGDAGLFGACALALFG
jgi:putative N-acetylmannosamine-6-phosphate epimerase